MKDTDGDALQRRIIPPLPAHGSARVEGNCFGGAYFGEAGFGGTDSITYEVTDNYFSDIATVSVTVLGLGLGGMFVDDEGHIEAIAFTAIT